MCNLVRDWICRQPWPQSEFLFRAGIKSCTTQLFQDTSHYIPLLWSLVYLVNNICHSVFVSAMNREVQVNTSHTNAFTRVITKQENEGKF